jgi:hypothetical protein
MFLHKSRLYPSVFDIVPSMTVKIGTLKESSLHADLKTHYSQADDRVEVEIDGYWVDILHHDSSDCEDRIVEIQTGNFSALKLKLQDLLKSYRVMVVYPIAQEKYIQRVKQDSSGKEIPLSRRKSPKRGRAEEVFGELVYLPELAVHPHFSLKIALIREIQIWRDDGRGSWRRRGVTILDRRLESILGERFFCGQADYLQFIPDVLSEPFTVKDLASVLNLPTHLAGKMVYSLRKMDTIRFVGKQGNAHLYVKYV